MENTKQKYHNKYRVPSARAEWHDYNGGAYFITICTKNREHFFGEIEKGEMVLSRIGEYADKNISEITQHNCYAEIPLWIVMPDHIHMVVIIDETKTSHEKRVIDNGVETFPETSQYSNQLMTQYSNKIMTTETFQETSLQGGNRMSRATQMQSWLSVVIRQFKQSVTRFARITQPDFAWQERYYDRIIRNQCEMNRIAKYIEDNVAKWCDGMKIDY